MSFLFSTDRSFIYNGITYHYTIISDTHPPFYYLLLKLWIFLFGKDEMILRLLSFIFSFLTSIVIYFICDFYTQDKFINVLSVLVFLLNPLVNSQANNIRMYNLLIFLLTLSYLLLIHYMDKPNIVILVLLSITTILALYTHYFSMFTYIGIVFIEIVSYFVHRIDRKTFISLLIKDFVAVLSFLPWFIYKVLFIIEYNNTRWNWIPEASFQVMTNIFTNIFYNLIFFLLVLILITFTYFIIDKNDFLKPLFNDMIVLSFFTFFIPFTTSIFKIILNSSIMLDYYLLFLTVPFAILFYSSILAITSKFFTKLKLIRKKQKDLKTWIIFLIVLILIFIPVTKIYNLNTAYPLYDQLVPQLLDDNSSAILISPRGYNILLYYLSNSFNNRIITVPYSNITSHAFISQIKLLMNNFSFIWYNKHKYYNSMTENTTEIINYLNTIGTKNSYFRDNNGLLEAWKYTFTQTYS